jgi:flagellar biosynthesis protein FliQ
MFLACEQSKVTRKLNFYYRKKCKLHLKLEGTERLHTSAHWISIVWNATKTIDNEGWCLMRFIISLSYCLSTACIHYTRPNYAFSEFFLIDREKQDKILFISRSIFNQIQPNFNQFFLRRWEMHSKNFVWICLVFLELSCSQTNTHIHTHTYTYKPRWLHNLLAVVTIGHWETEYLRPHWISMVWNATKTIGN